MYKFRIYKTSCINNDNLDHEEFFKNEGEMYKRYRELLYDRKDCITVWKSTNTNGKYVMLKCCANCRNHAFLLKENRYKDIETFCMVNGYFTSYIFKDIRKIKIYSPGGKELECKFQQKME